MTLENVTAVVESWISIQLEPGLVNVARPETVVVPPPTPWINESPEPFVTVIVPKERVPAELFCSDMPSVPAVMLVFPKLMLPVDVPTKIPCVPEPIVVEVPKLAATLDPVMEIP